MGIWVEPNGLECDGLKYRRVGRKNKVLNRTRAVWLGLNRPIGQSSSGRANPFGSL